jgi:hypothetical protein
VRWVLLVLVIDVDMSILNRRRSASLGEEHDSKGRSNSSGGKVSSESSNYCSGISVGSADSSPDGLTYHRNTLNLFSALPE